MRYNEYLQERLNSMYETIDNKETVKILNEAYEELDDEIVVEGKRYDKAFLGSVDDKITDKQIRELKMGKKSFLKYLKKRYPDFQESEITGAKTKEEMDAVREKYLTDFKNWAKIQGHMQGSAWKYLVGLASQFILPPVALYFTICLWGSVIKWWKASKAVKKGRNLKINDVEPEDDRSFN
jgi:hypothetical protein